MGGKEDAKQRRSYDTKKTVIAVELTDKNKVKHVYVKAIEIIDKMKRLQPIKMRYNMEQKKVPTHVSKGIFNPVLIRLPL